MTSERSGNKHMDHFPWAVAIYQEKRQISTTICMTIFPSVTPPVAARMKALDCHVHGYLKPKKTPRRVSCKHKPETPKYETRRRDYVATSKRISLYPPIASFDRLKGRVRIIVRFRQPGYKKHHRGDCSRVNCYSASTTFSTHVHLFI